MKVTHFKCIFIKIEDLKPKSNLTYLATSTQIDYTEISNAFNTILTFFQTSGYSKTFNANDAHNMRLGT